MPKSNTNKNKKRTRQTKRPAKVTNMPPPPTRTRLSAKVDDKKKETQNTKEKNDGNEGQQIEIEMSKESFELLKLENCQVKNICDELKNKVQMMEKDHTKELKTLKKNVESLEKKNDLLQKQESLSTDIVQRNENLKKENNQLKNEIQNLEKKVLMQKELIEEDSDLKKELEIANIKLENFQSMKANHQKMEEELAIAKRTLDFMKDNIVMEKIYSAKEKRYVLESIGNEAYDEQGSGDSNAVAHDEKSKCDEYVRPFPRWHSGNRNYHRYTDIRNDIQDKSFQSKFTTRKLSNERYQPPANFRKNPSRFNQSHGINAAKSSYNKSHPYK